VKVWSRGGLFLVCAVLALAGCVERDLETLLGPYPSLVPLPVRAAKSDTAGAGETAPPWDPTVGRRRSRQVYPGVPDAAPVANTAAPEPPPSGFAPQVRLGFAAGDGWEPAIATDKLGNVYVLYPQYGGVPGCPTCPNPTMVLQRSPDRGATWETPTVLGTPGSGQWDAQIAVDPADGRTVYAAWLQDEKSAIAVARSDDLGASWSISLANKTRAATDKPILVVRDGRVYVAYNRAQKMWLSSSQDGGRTFASVSLNSSGRGWPLASGGAIDPAGVVYFGWAGYQANGSARGAVSLFLTRSTNGGATWTQHPLDVSGAPATCPEYACGWAYLGAQVALATDDGGALYALWNASSADFAPARMYFSRSLDRGATWSPRRDVSLARVGPEHTFPAIAAAAAGDVRIAWMDARANRNGTPVWNVYTRASLDGGSTWETEKDISTPVPGYEYLYPEGFRFPFGDYFEIEIDAGGMLHVVSGQGFNYDSPGAIWYTRGS
jgi:hypothetical protein